MIKASLTLSLVIISLFSANSKGELIAFDLTAQGAQNLTGYHNGHQDGFNNKNDYFQTFSVTNLERLPASLVNSAPTDPTDALGIVTQASYGDIFAISDTINSQNPTESVAAVWEFDIVGFSDLVLSMDFAAMGDFESSDTYLVEVSIDRQIEQGISFVTELSLTESYLLAPNKTVTLNDPLSVDGQVLSNEFINVSRVLAHTGNRLRLQLLAKSDGGSEVFAMQNIRVTGNRATTSLPTAIEVPEPVGFGYLYGVSMLFLARRSVGTKTKL